MTAWTYPRSSVMRVVDGDTLFVRLDRGFHDFSDRTVRLAGIDADEMTSPDPAKRAHATEAKRRLVILLPPGTLCTVTSERLDKYGRALARVVLEDGTDLSALLVAEGLARTYAGGAR